MGEVSASRHVVMLLTNNSYPHDSRVPKEAQALIDAGYRVSVISKRARRSPRRETIEGVRVHRFRLPGDAQTPLGYVFEFLYAALASFALSVRILVREGYDVLHLHNPPDTLGLVAVLHKKLFRKRVVFDHHDLAAEMYHVRFEGRSNPIVHRALVAFERLCCRTADLVIATNESYRAYDIERYGVHPDRVVVVRNGPSQTFLDPVQPDQALREGVEAVVGYIGVIGYQDRLDYLLGAMRHLVFERGRASVRCVIIGRGDALEAMKRLSGELGLDGHVRFTGELRGETLRSSLAASDVCVVPDPSNAYNDRSTMIKIMEYMAIGKPIVAFDLPENRISAQDAAVYVQPNDVTAFGDAIVDLIDDPVRRREMSEFGRDRVAHELMWANSVPHLLDGYARLFGDRERS